jgi:SAM-dependent methyltransferase
VFVHPQPSPEEIEKMYGEEYFTECTEEAGAHGPKAYMEMASESAEARRHAARELHRRLLRHLKRTGTLVEVGCGPGFFLKEMQGLGWQVAGVEISEYAVRFARERLGLNVILGNIESDTFPRESVDAVFMGDVLEHLPHPLNALRAVRHWLRPDSILVIAVPSTLNLLSARIGMALYRRLRRFKTLRIPPYHLFEYTPRTLRLTLRTAGYELEELRQSTVPIGKMGLRGSRLENSAKVILQLTAIVTTRLFNTWGDRLTAIARPMEAHTSS